MAEKIISRKKSYPDWYIDIVLKAKLADYSEVKGAMIICPRGYAIWERMQTILNSKFKDTGHSNAYFPMLIPMHYIQKEKEHVKGFSPELAVVTHGGGEELEEPLVIRPTSETVIWSAFSKWIQSYRDLPLLINQWANVVRWEKRTRPFLRTSEFLWQEGHTAHETKEEAREETLRMLDVYRNFVEDFLAIPVLFGMKSESEKFAGAIETYAIEGMMQDGKSLQMGTSHFLGQNFAKAFDVQFQTRKGDREFVWASSWGVSTRLIGAMIMVHSDDKGLVIPPAVAPTEMVIVPIFNSENKTEVIGYAEKVYDLLQGHRVEKDYDEQNSPGWKFAEWELRGVPIRIELGPRDMERHEVVLARRDTGEKKNVALSELAKESAILLKEIQSSLYDKALHFRQKNTHTLSSFDELAQQMKSSPPGFVKAFWDGTPESEATIKEKTKATIRFISSESVSPTATCIYSGNPAKHIVYFAKSY